VAALVGCVDADGKLTHVQPIGADPKKFAEDSTEALRRRRVFARGQRGLSDGGFVKIAKDTFRKTVKIDQSCKFLRDSETVETI
jgi:hypothetical protein